MALLAALLAATALGAPLPPHSGSPLTPGEKLDKTEDKTEERTMDKPLPSMPDAAHVAHSTDTGAWPALTSASGSASATAMDKGSLMDSAAATAATAATDEHELNNSMGSAMGSAMGSDPGTDLGTELTSDLHSPLLPAPRKKARSLVGGCP